MPQSLSRVLVHLVFSTKHRQPFITPAHRERVFDYLGGTLASLGCTPIRVGGMPDHVHLLFALAKTLAVSKVVEEVKKESSAWAKPRVHPDFYWQNGYGAFSVSSSLTNTVREYIENQEAHHHARTFQDEFRGLLRPHEVEWDEQYVWD